MATRIKESGEIAPESGPPPDITRPLALWRALLLGLILIPINVFWTTIVEIRWYTLDGTSLPLFITPIFLLFGLVIFGLLGRKLFPRLSPLRQEEMLLVYVMLVVSCTFAGHDTLQNMFGAIPYAYWHASLENKWAVESTHDFFHSSSDLEIALDSVFSKVLDKPLETVPHKTLP